MKIKSAYYDTPENGLHITTDGQGEYFLHCKREDIIKDKQERLVNTSAPVGTLVASDTRLSPIDYFLFANAREDKWVKT